MRHPYLCASRTAKEEMSKQQIRFFNIIRITTERALSQYNIPTIESYIDQHCVAVTERILNYQHHPITVALENKKSPHNTRGSHLITRRTITKKYHHTSNYVLIF